VKALFKKCFVYFGQNQIQSKIRCHIPQLCGEALHYLFVYLKEKLKASK